MASIDTFMEPQQMRLHPVPTVIPRTAAAILARLAKERALKLPLDMDSQMSNE